MYIGSIRSTKQVSFFAFLTLRIHLFDLVKEIKSQSYGSVIFISLKKTTKNKAHNYVQSRYCSTMSTAFAVKF